MITLKDYEAALALLDERHFARTARRLGVSQPALTARLRRLEEELGSRLFERSRRGVVPTPAGLVFCEGAQRVLDASEETRNAVEATENGYGLTLRVGMTQLSTHHSVIPALKRFRRVHPGAKVQLLEGITWSLERDLEQSVLDVAFLHPPLHAPGLSHRVLHTSNLIQVSAGEPHSDGRQVEYIRSEAPVLMGVIDRYQSKDARTAPAVPVAQANTGISALALSAAGYGPAYITDDLPDFGFEVQRMDHHRSIMPLDTSIAWRSLDRRKALRAFLDAALPSTNLD